MLEESRRMHDIFVEWTQKYPNARTEGLRFKADYWLPKWTEHLELYEKWGFSIIPIAARTKKPFLGWAWADKELPYDRALELVAKDINIAVVLGKSNLILIDWDTRKLPEQLKMFLNKTLAAISPHGYHLYFRPTEETETTYEKMRKAVKGKGDMFRGDIQYVLLPLSVVANTCSCGNRIEFSDQFCPKCARKITFHPEPKCYEWVNLQEPISFKELKKAII
jgi:hypothetical protein